MKKKKLEDIKKEGWSIADKDQQKVDARKSALDMTAAAGQISAAARQIAAAAHEAKTYKAASAKQLDVLIGAQATLFKGLAEEIASLQPANWELNVRRNADGFISKIYAKRTTAK